MSDTRSQRNMTESIRARALFLLLPLLFTALAAAAQFGDFRRPYHARLFVALMFVAGACGITAALWIGGVPQRWRVLLLAAVAVGIRVVLLPTDPGDDFWRYVWEGRVQLDGLNPYRLSPESPELTYLQDETWSWINHRETAAIYPPLMELILAGITAISHSPVAFKIVFGMGDIAIAGMIWALCTPETRVLRTALYAWNPAVAYASAGGAHFDSLMVCALTGAVLVFDRSDRNSRNALMSSMLLGLSIALKVVSAFLLPLWSWTLRRKWWCLLVVPLVCILPAIPYGGLDVVTRNLRGFADVTRFNDLVWWVPEMIFGPNPYGRNWPFTVAIVVACAVATWRLRDDWRRATFWILGLALILSPVLHPWYVTWILPLACWRGNIAWSILSVSVLSAFLLWESTPMWTEWQPNLVTRALVILPPVLWMLWERSAKRAAT